MRLVDTSAWVEWLVAAQVGLLVRDAIPPRSEWVVPTIVQLELMKWLTREVGEDKADEVIAFTQTCQVAPLTTEIALDAAELCARHKLATPDAIIYATARPHGSNLLTCNAHLEGLPGVTYLRKS